jgi:pimeloyl-ACP methyl ester carboxylesterase
MARPVLAIGGIALIAVEGKSDGGNRDIGVTSDSSALRTLQLDTDSGHFCPMGAPGPLLSHRDTRSVVEDVEAIRGALDELTISWLGVSYGTEIGAAYAATYPGHVRAMVLTARWTTPSRCARPSWRRPRRPKTACGGS